MGQDEIFLKRISEAVEATLVRFGFRVADPNEIQEDMLFVRRLRLGNPLARLERMEVQLAEHEKRDEQRQLEILRALGEASSGRELLHKRISDLKLSVANEIQTVKTTVDNSISAISTGPLEELRKDNRNALIAMLGVALTIIGVLLVTYVFPKVP